jgi:subtilisin family serine protease
MRDHTRQLLRVVALVAVVAGAVVGVAPAPARAAASTTSAPRPERVVVSFRPGTTLAAMRAAHGRVAHARVGQRVAALRADAVVVPAGEVDAAVASYRAMPEVAWAGREGHVQAMSHVADRNFADGSQWNLVEGPPGTTNWHAVYQDGFGQGVVVAIVDTGVGRAGAGGYDGFEHPFAPGIDLVDGDFIADDDNGHGTHIAGTVAQAVNNDTGTQTNGQPRANVAGVAPDALIMPVRVLNAAGGGSPLAAAVGVMWAVDHGAQVVNLSLGGEYSKPMCDAVTYATDRNVLVVAASGNESESGMVPVAYPAACPGAVAVGGHRWDATRGPYSNGSCELAFTAPGGDLSANGRLFPPLNRLQEDPRNGILQEAWDPSRADFAFFYDSGTSMAAAHASGAAAVLMAPPFSKPAKDVATILRNTARDTGDVGLDPEHGAGVLDIAAAVNAVRTGNVPTLRDRVGYWMVASDGGIFAFGDAPFFGSTGNIKLNSPIVAMARTPTGHGYWMVAADGGMFTFGDAGFFGSAGGLPLNKPIVGMAVTPSGRGYWLVSADGGVFTFGDAQPFGAKGGQPLNNAIIGMAPTRTGLGYWLFAADGGVFAFGDAQFFGSTGNLRLNAPIVSVAPTPTGLGYWMVATDGGIFSFGDAPFFGSTGDIKLNKPILTMAPTCFGRGYWLIASDGGVFSFGAAPFLGSTGDIKLNKPIVGMSVAIDMRAAQL